MIEFVDARAVSTETTRYENKERNVPSYVSCVLLVYVTLLYVIINSRGSNSVVECQLPKLDVAGSSPVSRSK